jgi:hypothetical protein
VESNFQGQTYNLASYVRRWGSKAVFAKGHLAVPSFFLQHYAQLDPPLNSGEAMFVLQLMNFKWGLEAPFPAYRTIAQRMGISVKMARNHAKNLEEMNYLCRQEHTGFTTHFDLTPLLRVLARRAQKARL